MNIKTVIANVDFIEWFYWYCHISTEKRKRRKQKFHFNVNIESYLLFVFLYCHFLRFEKRMVVIWTLSLLWKYWKKFQFLEHKKIQHTQGLNEIFWKLLRYAKLCIRLKFKRENKLLGFVRFIIKHEIKFIQLNKHSFCYFVSASIHCGA